MSPNFRQLYANQTVIAFVLPLLLGFFNPIFFEKNKKEAKTANLSVNCGNAAPFILFHQKGQKASFVKNERCALSASTYKIKVVVLDAGHGGHDPGCSGAHSTEKENTLATVLKIGAQIEANFPQIKVVYTRTTDIFVPLIDRARIANEAKADLFISVHCNSLPVKKSEIEGTEVYVLGLHVAERNLDVAKRENAAIFLEKNYQKTYSNFDPASPEGTIFISAWQSAYLEQSIAFASLINDQILKSDRKARGVRQAGFMVLKETAAPSVLIETAYLTSETDENYIASEDGQMDIATRIFTAFSSWKQMMEGGISAQKTTLKSTKASKTPAVAAQKTIQNDPKSVAAHPQKMPQQVAATKILLTTSTKKLNLQKDPLALVGSVEEQKKDGKFQYFAVGFASKMEAQKSLSEIKRMGFPEAKIVD